MAMPRVAVSVPKPRSFVLRDTHPVNRDGAAKAPDTARENRRDDKFPWLFIRDHKATDSVPFGREVPPHPQHLVAIRTHARIARDWNLSESEAAGLLGMETSTWSHIMVSTRAASQLQRELRETEPGAHVVDRVSKEHFDHLLNQEQLTRISNLSAIYRLLKLMNMECFKPRWLIRQNTDAVFDGKAPLDAMIDGGATKIQEVRKYLEYQFGR